MHRTDGPDDFGGIYKETAPATVINAYAMNALQEEIAGAVEWSGQTLAADGPADASAQWKQLRNAIAELQAANTLKTISLRLQSGNVVDAVDFTASYLRHSMRQLVTLFIPKVSFSISPSSGFLKLWGGGGIDLPAAIRPKNEIYFPVVYHDDTYAYTFKEGIAAMTYDAAPNPNFGIYTHPGVDFTGSFHFEACCLTYFV